MTAKLCSRCKKSPAGSGGYCKRCFAAYKRERRQRRRAAAGEPAVCSRQQAQRPAVDDIPDAVRVRIVQDMDGWTVAVRSGQRWARVFRSDDRDEALLVLGAALGRDIR